MMRQYQPALVLALAALTAASWNPFSHSSADESWTPPRETSVSEQEQQLALGWTPKPTPAPMALFGRMEVPRIEGYTLSPGTCGFVSENGNSYTCIDSEATCTLSDGYVGCCNPSSNCNVVKTTCIDYNSIQAGGCNPPDDFHTLCCQTQLYGKCYTWLFSTTASEGEEQSTWSFLDCSAQEGTGTLLDYDPRWSLTHSFPPTTTSSPATTTTNPEASSTTTNEGGGGRSSTNVGAIAGGTVGGVAVIGIIAAGAFWYFRRGKKSAGKTSTPSQNSPPAPMSQYNASSPPPNTLSPTSPGGAAYPSGVPTNFSGYSPSSPPPHQSYNPNMQAGYQQQGYPQQGYPQQGYPQQGYQQDYQQHQQRASYSNYASPTSTSPAQFTTPSPAGGHNPQSPQQNMASELQAVNPVGAANNRAELS